ncbi:MAG: hypothetical protein CMM58_10135 [Rhodospirillaceae bacterium]|nr:hypothetical protein [Rhodospirillaceae bacterium]|tara:strand:- start:383 stop:892 length:510 start_codon:yes stop_codon:yes gene_type:complete
MGTAFFYSVSRYARQMVPLSTVFILIIVSATPLAFVGNSSVFPYLNIVAVFYWSLYRPDRLPILGILAVGIFQDLLLGTMIGFMPILFLIAHGSTVSQRRLLLGKSFYFIWLGFTIICGITSLIAWGLLSLLVGQTAEVVALLVKLGMTISSFPIMFWVLGRLHRSFMD